MLDKKQLSDYTGLTPDYIQKCISYLDNILKPYYHFGDNRKYLFDGNAIEIFKRISVYKKEEINIKEIKRRLEIEMKDLIKEDNKVSKPLSEPVSKPIQTNKQTEQLLTKIFDLQERLITEKDDKAEAYKQKSEATASQVEAERELNKYRLLLPAGKTPEEITKELEEQAVKLSEANKREEETKQKIKVITQQLEKTPFYKIGRKKKLVEELEKLSDEK